MVSPDLSEVPFLTKPPGKISQRSCTRLRMAEPKWSCWPPATGSIEDRGRQIFETHMCFYLEAWLMFWANGVPTSITQSRRGGQLAVWTRGSCPGQTKRVVPTVTIALLTFVIPRSPVKLHYRELHVNCAQEMWGWVCPGVGKAISGRITGRSTEKPAVRINL